MSRKTNWKAVFREGMRLYFAPIVGAVRGIREEYARIEADMDARYKAEDEAAAAEEAKAEANASALRHSISRQS